MLVVLADVSTEDIVLRIVTPCSLEYIYILWRTLLSVFRVEN